VWWKKKKDFVGPLHEEKAKKGGKENWCKKTVDPYEGT
jgi:hypothetical protein